MLGAIFGDIVGSVYEFHNTHDYDFELLSDRSEVTDDTVMTLAVAEALMNNYGKSDREIKDTLIWSMKSWGSRYPDAGYGGMFYHWVLGKDTKPYYSFGNGSAMRVSAAGWLYPTLKETRRVARLTAEVTHNHPEGIKGAEATAAAIYHARTGKSKDFIRDYIEKEFGYDLHKGMDEIVSHGHGEEICQVSVPQALVCFLNSESYIDTIRKAVSIGGDSDTIACIAGGIAEAFYGMDEEYQEAARARMDDRMLAVIDQFREFLETDEDEKSTGISSEPLEKAIHAFYTDRTEDRFMFIYHVISNLLILGGRIFIPAHSDTLLIDPDEIEVGKTYQLDQNQRITVIMYENESGQKLLPFFTSHDLLSETLPHSNVVLNYDMRTLFREIQESEEVVGLLINPEGEEFFLSLDDVSLLLDRAFLQEIDSDGGITIT